MREHIANLAHDTLTGGSLQSYMTQGPGDISSFMGWFNDATSLRQPKPNQQLKRVLSKGSVVQVVSTGAFSSHIKEIDIDTQPGAAAVGESIFFWSGPNGFIGYDIEAQVALGGGQTRLTLSDLPNPAQTTQTQVPTTGWNYSITDSNSATSTSDWDVDGIGTGYPENATQWQPQWLDYWDRINNKVLATTGHETGRGWNGVTDSARQKLANGWPTPHAFTGVADYCTAENFSLTLGNFEPDNTANTYSINTVNLENLMASMYFAASFAKDIPNDFMLSKPHGTTIEIMIAANSYTGVQNNQQLHAAVGRFFHALIATVPKTIAFCGTDGSNSACIMEEFFLDFNLNRTANKEIGIYNEGGGGTGSAGPLMSFTFNTPDWGERGYAIRKGNFLGLINCAAFPVGYGNAYNPSTWPGGFTPRAGNDEVTASDWASFVTAGLLTASEQVRRINFATYQNMTVTNYLRSAAPSHWTTSHFYGPQQPHPNDGDGTYTVATLPQMIRDPGVNTGAVVDTNSSLFLGPCEALWLEVF